MSHVIEQIFPFPNIVINTLQKKKRTNPIFYLRDATEVIYNNRVM